jgi:DNA-binding CsgD family transcriptional regulator
MRKPAMKLPDSKLSGMASLTSREKEVLQWVAQGKTNGEIGIILGISGLTVKKHIEHLFTKLGVDNRVSLAMNSNSHAGGPKNTPNGV